MKKIITYVTIVVVLIATVLLFRNLRFEFGDDNLGSIGVFEEIKNDNGEVQMRQTNLFGSDIDKIYFEAVAKKRSIRKAEITWYSGEGNENPIKIEKVNRNSDGCFESSITDKEGLKSGNYNVEIKVKSKSKTATEEVKFVVK